MFCAELLEQLKEIQSGVCCFACFPEGQKIAGSVLRNIWMENFLS